MNVPRTLRVPVMVPPVVATAPRAARAAAAVVAPVPPALIGRAAFASSFSAPKRAFTSLA